MSLSLKQMHAEAVQAHHDLTIGDKAESVVSENGLRVTYTRANASKILVHIISLESQLGMKPRYHAIPVSF